MMISAECAATISYSRTPAKLADYFKKSYGYAVFPTIGKAGLGIGGAHGSGCVYEKGKQVGAAKINQVSFGWQAGAQGYSLLVFFEDDRAFKTSHRATSSSGRSQCRRHHGGSVRRRRYERCVLWRKRRKE